MADPLEWHDLPLMTDFVTDSNRAMFAMWGNIVEWRGRFVLKAGGTFTPKKYTFIVKGALPPDIRPASATDLACAHSGTSDGTVNTYRVTVNPDGSADAWVYGTGVTWLGLTLSYAL